MRYVKRTCFGHANLDREGRKVLMNEGDVSTTAPLVTPMQGYFAQSLSHSKTPLVKENASILELLFFPSFRRAPRATVPCEN
jgi:hypothetical protein